MSIARHHAEWLSLVPVSGPFLSLPVLMEAFNAGLEPHDPDHVRLLRQEYAAWRESLEKHKADPTYMRRWIKFVLNGTLELDDPWLAEGQAIPQTLQTEVSEHQEFLRPDIVLIDPADKKPRLLIQTYPRSQELTGYVAGSRWKASPDTRMTELLHATGVRLGLVTNGEHWMLVDAPRGETSGYASWYASLWFDEPLTLRAFRGLLSASRFFNVPDDQTLEALLRKSASNQQEVTDQLGYQVRRAVEVLIHSLDRADQDFGRELLAGVKEEVLYESALTVMMRLVFLFCAEERELIPSKPFPVYEQNYSVSTISKQLRELADQQGEELLERRYDAWPRLLAAFRAVHGGLRHDDVFIPAYGGSLFDPDRFPFLEGRKAGASWRNAEARPLPVNNRTVLHLLEALQLLQLKVPGGGPAEARRVSFRALDIEQIGHVYEGLLDHTAKRASEPFLGLAGTRDKEPELPLARLEELLAKGETDLLKFLKDETGKSESALKKALKVEIDTLAAARFRTVCQGDDVLWGRVKPFAGLARPDSFGYPVVIPQGSVFVTEGTDRRSSGTHYTPKSLTEPIVQYTLEPLVYVGPAEGMPKEKWKLKSAKELLDLKICDMACGSGAFLVQACRYMAERVMEAWEEVEQRAKPRRQDNFLRPKSDAPRTLPRITPYGETSEGNLIDEFVPVDPDERRTYALRIVAQRCLYGVDKNPLAAEMAKLSLWLLTLAKDKPFEFLDHAIRCGDSLVGVDDEQLKTFSLDRKGLGITLRGMLDLVPKIMEATRQLRLQLQKIGNDSIENVKRKEELFRNVRFQSRRLDYAANRLLAASWSAGNPSERAARLRETLSSVEERLRGDDFKTIERESRTHLDKAGCPSPFHWAIEFPEVFLGRGGFDAFVGNPPFMGGKKITGSLGTEYRDFLVEHIGRGTKGHADLCAYFFLRAADLLRDGGQFGLIATNTIAQGDTREVGLDQLTGDGRVIPRAVPSRKWPGTANLEVAHVWIRKGAWNGPFALDDRPASGVTSFLTEPSAVSGPPHRLAANAGKSFIGSYVLGMGFVMEPEEAQRLIDKDPRNRDVLFPYLNGEDLNSRPDQSPSRWVINFFDWPLDRASAPAGYSGPVAADYPDCLAIVEEKVKPERTRVDENGEFVLRKPLPHRWWHYADKRPELYRTIAGMERVLVGVRHSKYLLLSPYSGNLVYSDALYVIAVSDYHHLGVFQSTIHECWARAYSGSLETRLRYSPSDCFETFPIPADNQSAEKPGKAVQTLRQYLMEQWSLPFTDLYNRFHEPGETATDIQSLRDLHLEMDKAVAAAYGWIDLALDHGFHETKQGVRFTISESARREVLSRLLKLNHERHAEEVAQGLHDKGKAKPKAAGRKGKGKAGSEPSLFGEED